MTPEEIQIQIDELETRVDRLRSLYEQYFVGLERLEPHVQKKDVERRYQFLRRESFRNTAMRFRFQMLVQRYTTYLTYWQRICRKIEDGTYKRDLARAQRYGSKLAAAGGETPELSLEAEDLSAVLESMDEDVEHATAEHEVPTEIREPASFRPSKAPQPATRSASIPTPTAREHVREELPPEALAPPSEFPPAPSAPLIAPSLPPRTPSVPPPRVGSPSFPVANRPIPAPPAATGAANVRRALSPFGGGTRAGAPAAQPGVPSARPAATASPAAKPQPTAAKPTATPAAAARPVDAHVQSVYERYRDSRKRNGEADVSFDTVAKQIQESRTRLAAKYTTHDVSFDVTVKDGKTVLKPVVKPRST